MIVYPQVGDVGLPLGLTVVKDGNPLDISLATSIKIILRAPDGRAKTFDGTFKTNGEDGIIQYITTSANDLDTDGEWEIQGKMALGSFTGYTAVAIMPVRKNADRA